MSLILDGPLENNILELRHLKIFVSVVSPANPYFGMTQTIEMCIVFFTYSIM